jgi:DNA adenine methylase
MNIRSLAPWFGGKRTLAPRIVEVLGPHRAYWEPFCGSMAVLLSKPAASTETVNDLHGDLVNLARVIQSEESCARLYRRLRHTLPAEALFRDSLGVIRSGPAPAPGDPDEMVARAAHYFVVSWLGMNGVAGLSSSDTSFARRFTSRGGDAGGRFVGAVESIPDWHERLRAVTVLSGDGIELCEKVEDREGTVIYADPPYLEKNAEYLHDFTPLRSGGLFDAPSDHERLAAALGRFKLTRCVVSYYEHPELTRLYPGWVKLDIGCAKNMANSGGKAGRTESPEVLITNRKDG